MTAASSAAILLCVVERIPKSILVAAGVATLLLAVYAAYTRPGYFTSATYLGGIIFLELLVAAIWMYQRVFFPVLIFSFLMAGINLPVGRGWATARWVVLGVGAFVGLVTMLRERRHRFGFFDLVALFTVLTGVVSAAVSLYPDVALLKVLSILLLFVYAATGARIAAIGRENRFLNGLLIGCEIFVAANALLYAVGIAAMVNPNSLGAVMGIAGAPILLWGVLLGGKPYLRRLLLYVICICLVFTSHARAGIAAALFSSAILCLAVRKYKLLIEGTTVLVIVLATVALVRPNSISFLISSVVYKNGAEGILTSRISPWQTAVDSIRDHPWFGVGLGTTANGADADEEHGVFSSSQDVTRENGSSYLAILAGVGFVGAIPVAIMLFLLISKIMRTVSFVRSCGSVAHPAILLATVMIAGILHAGFEDWMFAPGNYLCMFFWSLAFIFMDVAPNRAVTRSLMTWRPLAPAHEMSPTSVMPRP